MYSGMQPGDVRLWGELSIEPRLRALRMANFPWNKLYLTDHIRKFNITFGVSLVQNDVQFHWLALALAESIRFWSESTVYYHKIINDKPIKHRGHTVQLTDISGIGRLQMFVGLHDAYSILVKSIHGFCKSSMALAWSDNVQGIVEWARKYRITPTSKDDFDALYHNSSLVCEEFPLKNL